MREMTVNARMIRNCSVERTLTIVSDTWTFLVLREFYLGARRFDQIQRVLGVPRSTLSSRLAALAEHDVIAKVPDPERNNRHEYRLTERGRELYLVMLSLLRFGDRHLHGGAPVPLRLTHRTCGHVFQPETACSACRANIEATEVTYRDGPGAGTSPAPVQAQRRRRGEPGAFERSRPSSVSRTLEIIADRWTFLILRELFLGSRRFDQFGAQLGVASAILATRLNRLTKAGIIRRSKYQDLPERFEYRLTTIGRDLYLPMIQMLHWGDRWLSHPAPMILTHQTCGQDFVPQIVCSCCREDIVAHDVRYDLNYAVASPDVAASARTPQNTMLNNSSPNERAKFESNPADPTIGSSRRRRATR